MYNMWKVVHAHCICRESNILSITTFFNSLNYCIIITDIITGDSNYLLNIRQELYRHKMHNLHNP